MAVAKMKLVSVIGHMTSLDRVVQTCGDSGVFQPDDAMTFFSDTSGLHIREGGKSLQRSSSPA